MKHKILAVITIFFILFGIFLLVKATFFNQSLSNPVEKEEETISLPALPVVLVTALVDSINPCAIGVLILLIGTLLALSRDKHKMLFIGIIYILTVYITYLLAGIGLLLFIPGLTAHKRNCSRSKKMIYLRLKTV